MGPPRQEYWSAPCVAISFSRDSSQPRNQTHIFCIAGGFFTHWVIREALSKPHTHGQIIRPSTPFASSTHCSFAGTMLDPQMCLSNWKHRLQLILSDLEKKVFINSRAVQHKLCFALLPKPTLMCGSRFQQATSILLHLELNIKRKSCSLQCWFETPQLQQWSAKNLEGHLPGDFLKSY